MRIRGLSTVRVREIRQLYEVQHEKLQQLRERLAESAALQQQDAKLLPSRETLRGTAPSLSQISRSNNRSISAEVREDFASVIPVMRSRVEFGPVVAKAREEATGGRKNFVPRSLFREKACLELKPDITRGLFCANSSRNLI